MNLKSKYDSIAGPEKAIAPARIVHFFLRRLPNFKPIKVLT